MREKFLIGIVAENPEAKSPPDLVDFIDFDAKREDKKPVVRIRFCPFCGKEETGALRMTEPT